MITSVVPRPTYVSLGGSPWFASEFRLGDLADLQSWVREAIPDPFEAVAWRLQRGSRDTAWKQLLAATIEARESYSPIFGDPIVSRLLDSPAGVKKQLTLSLRREHRDLDDARVDALHQQLSIGEYARFVRVAWGLDPANLITDLVDGPSPGPSKPPDWPDFWHCYITTAKGPAPGFADLTITQFQIWLSGGKLADGSVADRKDWREVAERRAAFWAG